MVALAAVTIAAALVPSVALKHRTALQDPATPQRSIAGMAYAHGGQAVEHAARRVEFQTLTVDDLDRAGLFYEKVLGAKELPFCREKGAGCTPEGYVRFSGDAHMEAMFALDKVPMLPNISSSGDMEVLSRFFAFRNSVVQLIAFHSSTTGERWSLREPHTAATYIGNAHICFWIEDGVDASLYVEAVENTSKSLGMHDVKFNRPTPLKSDDERNTVPKDRWANCIDGGAWEGNCATYFKGPAGEQYEIWAVERTFKQALGRGICERGGAGPMFLSTGPYRCKCNYCNMEAERAKLPTSQRLHGIAQQGFRTRDVHRAVGFYTEVMGGDLVSWPLPDGPGAQNPNLQFQLFANETFEAWKYAEEHGIDRAEAMRQYGLPDLATSDRLDLKFVLFDNFMVEALEYSAGLTYGAEGFDPELNHSSSPAYLTTISPSFGVGNESMTSYLAAYRSRLERQGYKSVAVPKSVASFPPGHPYEGLEYTYAKGPDGEAFSFVRIDGQFAKVLKDTFVEIGVVSTLFPETNAFAQGDMAQFCRYATEVPTYGAYEL